MCQALLPNPSLSTLFAYLSNPLKFHPILPRLAASVLYTGPKGGTMAGGKLPDDPEGFARFYQWIFERDLPRHARADWVLPLYAARAAGKGLVVEAFRGSSKTTTLSIAFSAFRLGQQPHKSVLLIQAADQAAASTSGQIADLIERHPGWKNAFPHVVPDRKVGWGARGYEVCNTDHAYE